MRQENKTETCVSYVAYMEGSLEVDYRDTSLQLCRGQNWKAHSCPTDEDRVQEMQAGKVKRKSGRIR